MTKLAITVFAASTCLMAGSWLKNDKTAFPPANAISIPSGSKIYIEPDHGFESFIAAAFVKKQVPVTMTKQKAEADYVLTNSVVEQEEKSGLGTLARCAYAMCWGIDGTQTATFELVNAKQEIIWGYNVRKVGATNFQSSAEALAKHLKEIIR